MALCPAPVRDGGKSAPVLYHPLHCAQLLWAKDIHENASPQGAQVCSGEEKLPLGLAGLKASCRQLE